MKNDTLNYKQFGVLKRLQNIRKMHFCRTSELSKIMKSSTLWSIVVFHWDGPITWNSSPQPILADHWNRVFLTRKLEKCQMTCVKRKLKNFNIDDVLICKNA